MRIAYLVNQYPARSHSFIRREILALEGQGFDVVRIALRGWDGVLADADDEAERARTRYVLRPGAMQLLLALTRALLTRPVRLMRALGLSWRMGRKSDRPLPIHLVYVAEACCIEPWLRDAGVQHLHAHFGTNSAEVAMLVHVLGGPPWSFTVHGPEEFDRAPLLGLAEKIHHCSFVVAISSFGRSQLYRLIRRDEWHKVQVVRCGVDNAFVDAPTVEPPAAPRIICVGRFHEQKGQLLLIEAAKILFVLGLNFEVVLVGDGDLRSEIETQLESYGIVDRVHLTGWLSGAEVREEILASRALVLPSFAEGLPVALMEAMALRRPVISTYIGGIPELVCPGEHGWLVPAGDADALACAMQACLDTSAEALGRMGEAAREAVLARHNIATEAAKLAVLIRRTNADLALPTRQ